MAENYVVKEQLTDAMIAAGESLMHKLDDIGLPIRAALWYFFPESNEWQLLISSPDVSSEGPRKVLERIHEALQLLGESAKQIPLALVTVLESNAEPVKYLDKFVQTGKSFNRIRVRRSAVNGHYIDDALIYRIT